MGKNRQSAAAARCCRSEVIFLHLLSKASLALAFFFYLTAVDRHSRRIRQKNRPHNNIILPQHVLPQIIITTETDYTNHASQIFVIFSYYYSIFTVVTFLFSKV
ncbi:hypothetical protein RCT73_04100, partial [Escherichia coli]|nr:hypothetical protein [Escherichia coli]